MSDTDLEERTQAIGRDIFSRVRQAGDASGGSWIGRRLMDWGMRDEHVKAQLFRFIDVLATLTSDAQVSGHLREYMLPVRDRLPMFAGRALSWLPRDGRDGILARSVASLARSNTRRMARRFIAASDLPEAIAAVRALRERQHAFTIDLLGEAVLSGVELERYQKAYLQLIDGLSADAQSWPTIDLIDRDPSPMKNVPVPISDSAENVPVPISDSAENVPVPISGQPFPAVNVSVKLSSLYSQFDPIDPAGTSAGVRNRLRPILRLARARGVFINIDMEQHSFKDTTLRIFREVFTEDEFRDWAHVGIAVQAYLKETGDDLAALAAWAEARGTPVWVRLVKGAYWDYESVIAQQNDWPIPVFAEKPETDANFEAQTTFLMDHASVLRPAIASHNIRSIAHALAAAEARKLPPRSFEFQMLYGMADPTKSALVAMGHRVRVYTPFGQLLPGMAYLVRRLLENTSNESFLRAGFRDHVPEEQLLMNPLEILRKKRLATPKRTEPAPAAKPFSNEPLSDFALEEPRRAMADALQTVAGQLGGSFPLVIDGKKIATGQWIESVNPSHRQQIVGRAARATTEHANAAVAAAKRAFASWRDTSAEARAALLQKSAAILRRRRFELAAWEVYETGKQWREADADIAEAIDFCEYYAREMLRLATPQRRDAPGEENEYFYVPRGIALVIAPWNFPLAILCGMSAATLAAGCTVIMKPAEQSPVVAAKLMEVFEEAAFPAGVISYLPGMGEEIGPVLVNHPDIAVIAFTGSRAVGLAIQEQASRTPPGQEHVKRVITEMGGKNAIIVDDDADLDEAVHGTVASAFGYAGQKCSACSRVIVLSSVHDVFLERLVEATRSLNIGPAEEPGSFVGPVIDEESRRRVLDYVAKGKAECRLAYAADVGALAEEGTFVGPHVFADVPPTAAIAREEIFGPVLAVIKANDLTEALSIANGTPYALTGGIYSRSPANIERVRRQFRVGNLYINRKITGALVDRQPFGGFKLSGVGAKAGGPDYLQQFLHPRTITENTLRRGFAPASDLQSAAAE